MLNEIKASVRALRQRVMMSIAKAVVDQINDSQGRQLVKIRVLSGETLSNVERFQNYGTTSYPPDSSDAAVVFAQGNRDQGIIVSVDNREFRLKNLEKGEVALYDDLGNKVHLKRSELLVEAVSQVHVVAPLLNIDAPIVNVNGMLNVNGAMNTTGVANLNGGMSVTGAATSNGKNIGDTHTHSGVQTGAGNTGPVN